MISHKKYFHWPNKPTPRANALTAVIEMLYAPFLERYGYGFHELSLKPDPMGGHCLKIKIDKLDSWGASLVHNLRASLPPLAFQILVEPGLHSKYLQHHIDTALENWLVAAKEMPPKGLAAYIEHESNQRNELTEADLTTAASALTSLKAQQKSNPHLDVLGKAIEEAKKRPPEWLRTLPDHEECPIPNAAFFPGRELTNLSDDVAQLGNTGFSNVVQALKQVYTRELLEGVLMNESPLRAFMRR